MWLFLLASWFFSAPFGESGYSWRDRGARQGSGVPAEDLPWALSSGPGSALWASGKAFGQWWLVHVTYLCLWSLQCLLPTSFQYSQSWDPPVSSTYLWGVFYCNPTFFQFGNIDLVNSGLFTQRASLTKKLNTNYTYARSTLHDFRSNFHLPTVLWKLQTNVQNIRWFSVCLREWQSCCVGRAQLSLS